MYTKRIEDGYITGAFQGLDIGVEITKEEYDELYELLTNVPQKEGYIYKLGTDKQWVEFEDTFTPEPSEQDDTNSMMIDHEYRLTLLELGI